MTKIKILTAILLILLAWACKSKIRNSNDVKPATGTVKFFNDYKKFGFIIQDSSTTEVFVQSSGLIDKIKENDRVRYDIEMDDKGLEAVNVKVIK